MDPIFQNHVSITPFSKTPYVEISTREIWLSCHLLSCHIFVCDTFNVIHFFFRVQYDGCANRWTFHPAALVKVCTFHVGDLVTIINDAAKVQQLQKGHGEWVETMRNVRVRTKLNNSLLINTLCFPFN